MGEFEQEDDYGGESSGALLSRPKFNSRKEYELRAGERAGQYETQQPSSSRRFLDDGKFREKLSDYHAGQGNFSQQ